MSSSPNRPPLAVAAEWVARITTIALEMFIPGLLGQWLDRRCGTNFLVGVGFALGLTAGMWHLLAIARQGEIERRKKQ